MCGFVVYKNSRVDKHELNLKIIDAIKHRGPDEQGVLSDGELTMLHARLSIIDLSSSQQPLSLGERFHIVFNGEIYNFKELRTNYLSNFSFETSGDTEVILALFSVLRERAFSLLRGMFSIVIWDKITSELFLARDFFGEKPLYVYVDENELSIASNLKSLALCLSCDLEISEKSLAHYLQYLYVEPCRSIFKNVYQVRPGSFEVLDLNSMRITKKEDFKKAKNFSLSRIGNLFLPQDLIFEKTRSLVVESVRQQLVADVPIATMLSGGIDSTIITSIAHKLKPSIESFSVGFEGVNEFEFASYAAKRIGIKLNKILVKNDEIVDLLTKITSFQGEPFADSSIIPSYKLFGEVSKSFKVGLSGDGADELFGGYENWYNDRLCRERLSFGFSLPIWTVQQYWKGKTFFTDKDLTLFGISIKKSGKHKTGIGLKKVLESDLLTYLPGDILRKSDVSSMANSLEMRSPFLNVELYRFISSVNSKLYIKQGSYKYILKETFKEELGEKIYNRGKQGFGAPMNLWMKDYKFRSFIDDMLLGEDSQISTILDSKHVKNCVMKYTYQSWILLCLELWLRDFRQSQG